MFNKNDYLSVIITEEISLAARSINVPEFFLREMEPVAGACQNEETSTLLYIFEQSSFPRYLNNDQHSRNV